MKIEKYVEIFLALKTANTQRRYRAVWEEWTKHAGLLPKNWTMEVASEYLALAKEKPAQPGRSSEVSSTVSQSTVYNKATILNSIFDNLLSYGSVRQNPFKHLKRTFTAKNGDRRPHVALPPDKVKQIISLPLQDRDGIRDSAILAILFGCGLRRSEVPRIRLSDVKETEHGSVYIRLIQTKSGTAQHVAVSDWVVEKLNALIAQRNEEGAKPEEPLFSRYWGRNGSRVPIGDVAIYRMFQRYCKLGGIKEKVTPHCARATAITQLLNQGFDHRDVCHFSRHSSVGMVEKYDKRRLTVEESPGKKIEY